MVQELLEENLAKTVRPIAFFGHGQIEQTRSKLLAVV